MSHLQDQIDVLLPDNVNGEVSVADTRNSFVIVTDDLHTKDDLLAGLRSDVDAKEAALGNPTIDGQVLSSTILGVRTWTNLLAGPQGEKGDTGEQGIPGVDGADSVVPGPAGDTGPQGDPGDQGIPGNDGADSVVPGPQGEQGDQGDQGDQGPAGTGINVLGIESSAVVITLTALAIGDSYVSNDVGLDSQGSPVAIDDVMRALDILVPSTWVTIGPLQGPQGIQGEQGDPGIQGEQGIQGEIGPIGLTGADSTVPGPQGEIGPTGADSTVPGPAGNDGADSTVPGPDGPQGVPGNDGADSVVPGPDGPQGIQGEDGPQGIPGVDGNDGAKGDTGLTGPQGEAGPGTNLLGTDTSANIILKNALVIGDAYTSTDSGVDSEGTPTVPNDVLRAIDILTPSTWVNVGNIQGPKGDQGIQGEDGIQGTPGLDGADSTVPGPEGPQGEPGTPADNAALLELMFPIGSIRFGSDPTGAIPGTWAQIPEGTFIMSTVGGAD